VNDDEGHLEELLGLRALDRLSGPERDLVDSHLATCEQCRGKLEYIGYAANYLARVDQDDVNDLLPEPGSPGGGEDLPFR
jgi:hypothetical protein